MLKGVLTFLVMVGTSCVVFAGLGILSWQMAAAVVVGSAIGSAVAKVRLPPVASSKVRRETSGTGAAQ